MQIPSESGQHFIVRRKRAKRQPTLVKSAEFPSVIFYAKMFGTAKKFKYLFENEFLRKTILSLFIRGADGFDRALY